MRTFRVVKKRHAAPAQRGCRRSFSTGHADERFRFQASLGAATVMVNFNLIHSLGNMDEEVDSAVATALGDAATDLSKLVTGDKVQDFTPGAIIKGKVSGK